MRLKVLRRMLVVVMVAGLSLFAALLVWGYDQILPPTPVDKECMCFEVKIKLPRPEQGETYRGVTIDYITIRSITGIIIVPWELVSWTSPAALEQDEQGNWFAKFTLCFQTKEARDMANNASLIVHYTTYTGPPGSGSTVTSQNRDARYDRWQTKVVCKSSSSRQPPNTGMPPGGGPPGGGPGPGDPEPPTFGCCEKNMDIGGIVRPAPQRRPGDSLPADPLAPSTPRSLPRHAGTARRGGVFGATWQERGPDGVQQHVFVEFQVLLTWDCEKTENRCIGGLKVEVKQAPQQFNPSSKTWNVAPVSQTIWTTKREKDCDGVGAMERITIQYEAVYPGTHAIGDPRANQGGARDTRLLKVKIALPEDKAKGKNEWVFSVEIHTEGNVIRLMSDETLD